MSDDANKVPPKASETTWLRAVDMAHDGNARHLLELLLFPTQTEGDGRTPIPGSFCELPQDQELRLRIVWALVAGPWPRGTTLDDLFTKTGWGSKKRPRVSDLEIDAAALYQESGAAADHLASLAEALGLKPESLTKRIQVRKRAATKKPK